jgi:hypothetical protein
MYGISALRWRSPNFNSNNSEILTALSYIKTSIIWFLLPVLVPMSGAASIAFIWLFSKNSIGFAGIFEFLISRILI